MFNSPAFGSSNKGPVGGPPPSGTSGPPPMKRNVDDPAYQKALKSSLFDFLREYAEFDFANSPKMKFLISLRDKVAKKIAGELVDPSLFPLYLARASELVSVTNIDVEGEVKVTPEDLEFISECLSTVMAKAHNSFISNGFSFEDAKNHLRGFNLSLTPSPN